MPVLPIAPSRGVGFVPRQLPGCVLWCRADQGLLLNGSSVAQWNDLSGQSNNLVQATAADQPTWSATAFNGKPGITFSSTNDQYLWNSQGINMSGATQVTAHCVFQQTGTGGPTAGVLFSQLSTTTVAGGAAYNLQGFLSDPGNLEATVYQGAGGTTYTVDQNAASDTALTLPCVVNVVYNAALANVVRATIRQNGIAQSTGHVPGGSPSATNFGNYSFALATIPSSNSFFFTGIIAEIAIFNQALTTPQLQLLEQYAALTWGVPVTGVNA